MEWVLILWLTTSGAEVQSPPVGIEFNSEAACQRGLERAVDTFGGFITRVYGICVAKGDRA